MKSVMTHSFSNAPTADIPRSSFDRSHGYKTTFDAGDLVPVFLDEVLPGDTMTLNPSMFARINTPIVPIMDNLFMDVHFFFVPTRQIWANFRKFMGEQADPDSSTDFTVPMLNTQQSAVQPGDLLDYLGWPVLKSGVEGSDLPIRAYHHIYNEWYRDQNLIDSHTVNFNDVSNTYTNANTLHKRGKRHDYFTSCLPWLQKGQAPDISLISNQTLPVSSTSSSSNLNLTVEAGSGGANRMLEIDSTYNQLQIDGGAPFSINPLVVDFANAEQITINELRQAFQIQKLLERDARSGTRYAELVKSHFGVDFMDVTYRPEFLGGTSSPIQFTEVPMTATNSTSQATGDLAAKGTVAIQGGGFTKSFTEHGFILGIASVRADLTYQQGLNRLWSRETRYDHYFPALAHLGEQAVLNKEIFWSTSASEREQVFGYQERWAEYRYKPSQITGKMRSDAADSLDVWHLSQDFTSTPTLGETFITDNPPIDRVVTFPDEPHFTMDCFFNYQCARPMPVFSVPGLIDHF